MNRSPLRSYEGQIKIFLILLVLFLAVAIYFNYHLLVVARDAIQDQAGQMTALEADLVRFELERDQMLRGLSADPSDSPYIPPTFLDRMARLRGMSAIEIIALDGRVISSSVPERVGRLDSLLHGPDEGPRRSLMNGGSLVDPAGGKAGSSYARIAAYRPIQDRRHAALGFIRVEEEVPILASVELNLRTIAALQAGGLAFVLALVFLFARWLLQPYRRLAAAAGEAPGAISGLLEEGAPGEPDYLVTAFQGVLGKLHEQEREVLRLKQEQGATAGAAALPGDRLVQGMTSAVLVFDGDGRLAVVNAAAERLLGLRRREAAGRPYGEILAPHPRLCDLVGRSLGSGESHSREVIPVVTPSGREAHLGAMVSPIRAEGEGAQGAPVQGAICLLADLTEIKSLRERVGLKENLAALGEMSAGIAHEFRNSLAAIQGFARLIARQGGNGRGAASRENAEAILREVGGVEKVVDDFLRFARPASLSLEEIDLRDLVESLAGEFHDDPLGKGIRLEVEGTFPRIVADENLVRQALQNLLRNAAESFAGRSGAAAEPESGAAPAPRIVMRGRPGEGRQGGVRIEIEDNGPGIPRQDLPRVFTPFFTTKERGTGLGLALVQKTAVLHDGRVEVESGEGRGTRFALVLPARPGTQVDSGPLP
ncbi:MAG TPA: ATP-binding protein [Candidatus Polarisedimenticolia bacterium]|nr:ATP-binding protein [Candidatus Polarisedimenticolia bacterium]